jgi:hypothetical protein
MSHNPRPGNPHRTAREEAIAYIQAVRDFWYPTQATPGMELDDLPADLLRRLADERRMTGGQIKSTQSPDHELQPAEPALDLLESYKGAP